MIRIFCLLALLWPGLVLAQGNVLPGQLGPFISGNNLSNALISAKNDSTIYLLPGNYTNRLSLHWGAGNGAPYLLYRKTNVTISAYGARFYFPTGYSCLVFRDCEGIALLGMTLESGARRGADPTNVTQSVQPPNDFTNQITANGVYATITLTNCQRIKIKDCILANNWNHGIIVDPKNGSAQTTNTLALLDTEIYGHGWSMFWSTSAALDGAAVVPYGGMLMSGCYIHDTARGFEQYPMPDSAEGNGNACTVVGNHFRNIWGFAADFERCVGGVFSGNTIDRDTNSFSVDALEPAPQGLRLNKVAMMTISGNTFNNGLCGIAPVLCTNLTIVGNVIRTRSAGIIFPAGGETLAHSTIRGNLFNNCKHGGIYGAPNLFWNDISGNSFFNCGDSWNGESIYFSSGTVSSNRFFGNHFFQANANKTALAISGVSGTGNIWSGNTIAGGYTNQWDIAQIARFKSEVLPSFGNITITVTNATPTHVAGNGSLCMVTDGRLFLRTNGAWLLK